MLEIIVGALIGGSLSIIATHLSNKSNIKLQKDLLIFNKELTTSEFQKETLLEIQEILIMLVRYHTTTFLRRRKEKVWDFVYENDIDEKIGTYDRRISLLEERIKNDNLRMELNKFTSIPVKLIFSSSESEALAISIEISDQYKVVKELIGIELRKL